MTTNLYGINPLADGDLLCERETGNSHDLRAGRGYQEQDYTHMRLYYRCVKIWMVKI